MAASAAGSKWFPVSLWRVLSRPSLVATQVRVPPVVGVLQRFPPRLAIPPIRPQGYALRVLSLPDMFAAGAVHGVGWSLLG
jgi:hypothetical protein